METKKNANQMIMQMMGIKLYNEAGSVCLLNDPTI